jgi:hypothetical protein
MGEHAPRSPGQAALDRRFTEDLVWAPAAEIIESAKAVAIVPRAEDIGPPGIRILPGYGHRITVQLASPIGPRVYVDLHGHARQVLQPSSDPR